MAGEWFKRLPARRKRAEPANLSPEERYRKSFAIEADPRKRYLLHNRTPCRIVVREAHGEVVLPPLAQRVVSGARLAPFSDELLLLRQRHQLRVREYRQPHRCFRFATMAVWLAVAVLAVIVIHDIVKEGTLERREVGISASFTALLVMAVIGAAMVAEWRRLRDEELADTEEGDIDFGMGGAFYDGNETIRRTKHIVTLVTVVVIGAVLPAIAIFVATDAKEFLVMDGGLHVVDGKESRFVGRMIQVTYTAVLSLFPAILYFQFDRHRVGTIRSEWVRSIFSMDKRMTTLADVNARYGDELGEASSYSTDSVRLLGGRNSPIVVATLLISLGWTLLVVQTDSFDFAGSREVAALADTAADAAERATAAADAAGEAIDGDVAAAAAEAARDQAVAASEEAEILADRSLDGDEPPTTVTPTSEPGGESADDPAAAADAAAAAAEDAAAAEASVEQPFFQFIVPTPSAAAMAFLGAYFFGAYLILRSYFRGDLRPKIYNQITARLITVVVLAYLIQTLFSEVENRVVWAVSFLAGVVPTTVLRRIGQLVSSIGTGPKSRARHERSWIKRAFTDAFGTPRALTQLDGVDIYDSTRLETEGITDIPSLARADLVTVMVSTRLPVGRLVDWMDQAVLILLLDDDSHEELDSRVRGLRRIGIRTASGVLHAFERGPADPLYQAAHRIISTPTDKRHAGGAIAVPEPADAQDHGTGPPAEATGGPAATVRLDASAEDAAKAATTGQALAAIETRPPGSNGDTAPSHADTGDTSLASLAAEIEREPAMQRILEWYESKKAETAPCPTIP